MRPSNENLKELLELEAEVKIMTARINEIRTQCKEAGTFSSKEYVCTVFTQTRTGLVGLETACIVLGRHKLDELGLIKTTEFQLVKVAKK